MSYDLLKVYVNNVFDAVKYHNWTPLQDFLESIKRSLGIVFIHSVNYRTWTSTISIDKRLITLYKNYFHTLLSMITNHRSLYSYMLDTRIQKQVLQNLIMEY